MSAEEDQQVTLTVRQARALRGAINIALELIDRRETGLLERFGQVELSQQSVLERINGQIQNRIETAIQIGFNTFDEVFAPEEAQAVRDVVSLFDQLRRSEDGREALVRIGALVRTDQPFDMAEEEAIGALLDKINPTGARPETVVVPGPDPVPTRELVDQTRPLLDSIEIAQREIDEGTTPWIGAEQSTVKIQVMQDALGEGRPSGCEGPMRELVVLIKIAVGAVENLEDDPVLLESLVDEADIAHRGTIGLLDERNCLRPQDVDELERQWDQNVLEEVFRVSTRRQDREGFINGAARPYLRALREAWMTRPSLPEGADITPRRRVALQEIDRLRQDLSGLPGTITSRAAREAANAIEAETNALDPDDVFCAGSFRHLIELTRNTMGAFTPTEDLPNTAARDLDAAQRVVTETMAEAECIDRRGQERLDDQYEDLLGIVEGERVGNPVETADAYLLTVRDLLFDGTSEFTVAGP